MEVSQKVLIKQPVETVWKVITDFKNCTNFISSIKKIEVLEEPKETLIGFKWKETREMFGKEATEIMWITEAVKNEYYQTRAESHGAIYISKLVVQAKGDVTQLSMSFSSSAQTIMAKIISSLMGFIIKGSMKKAMAKDLKDMKLHLESNV
ncbi:polyketide cyclase/dehydrase/lipid transport protein [Winogradskyella epiphytica]|uniref:Polyketide cyclase/dehydrase/lipid transport protein n=1 Tax=Winogradskyella epiphytica TaxID=262005 RepID=A0A2V4WTJ7_9FLAO|nr:SRPBCC family protein [Winogradskyella epiphytica]PYE79677.1 polyketide cyclase/dehydrase/lipid transport protein [Winogradskyella epiphytica]GGW73421.1 hypothetical protein GCM10008085_27030 [Winogradskyella epiphytica]